MDEAELYCTRRGDLWKFEWRVLRDECGWVLDKSDIKTWNKNFSQKPGLS